MGQRLNCQVRPSETETSVFLRNQCVPQKQVFSSKTSVPQKQEMPVCLLTKRAEMSNLYKGPSIDASFLFIWPSGFRGEYFLEIDQSETRIACGGHVC